MATPTGRAAHDLSHRQLLEFLSYFPQYVWGTCVGEVPMYLQKRRRKWYALHDIPTDVRKDIGKTRFVKSLETEYHHEAKRRAAILEVRWRTQIEEARTGQSDHIERDASYWRNALRSARTDHEKEIITDLIADEASDRVNRAAAKAGAFDLDEPAIARLPGVQDAHKFFAIATGAIVKTDEHLDEYLSNLSNEPKSVAMKRATVKRFSEEFPYLTDVTRKETQKWVNRMAQDGKAVSTIQRSLSELRGYWAYLISIEAASENNLPFERLTVPKPPKKATQRNARRPFEPGDVVGLLRAADDRRDGVLADLIRLAMWTGARIEELCSLRTDRVRKDHFTIEDAKTPAGWRQVPIHPQLQSTVDRLLGDSREEFLLPNLTTNKYGDRSNAIGKRFGRLKRAVGFSDAYVFHSIRMTVATLLDNAGVPENVAADLLGHDIPTMTYGVYSGGSSLEVKMNALKRIAYPSFT